MYQAEVVANYFVRKGIESGQHLTPLKLQKLLYFAHGWYLALTENSLLDSTIEAWKFGPVVPPIYHLLKRYGNDSISTEIEFVPRSGSSVDLEASTIKFLDWIWEVYAKFSAVQLSIYTHESNSPWSDVVKERGGITNLPRNVDIDDEKIKSYFKRVITNAPQRQTA